MGPSCGCFGGPILLQGEGLGLPDKSTLEHSMRFSAMRPPSHASLLRIWHVPEGKSHMPNSSPPPVCPGFSIHRQLGTAYVSATTGAVATALGLKSLTKVKCPSHSTGPQSSFIHLLPCHSSTLTYRPPITVPRVPHHPVALRATKQHLSSPSTCLH